MPFIERKRFTFVSQALAEDTFSVVRFKGVEGISRLYEFDITLASEDPEIDLKEVLQNPVTFSILRDDQDRVIHGILAQFEQLHEANQYIFYRAVLVPRLWQADLYHENQLFLDKTVPDIIEEILKQAGLTTDDYELKLTRQYPNWEYICQYGETDFDFISRWMEREGIYYYFEQTDEGEKLIITDSSTAHQDIAGEKTLHYSPPSALIPTEAEVVKALICRQKMLPKKVILKDYNYRKPTLELKGEADVDSQGRGSVYLYGEHFKTPEDGNDLAKIRSEEILCREKVFHGETTAPALCPGFIFELADHYRDSYNQRCLITEVEHEGSQAGVLLAGLEEEQAGQETELVYSNRFVDIPADVQFRPERKTHKPRFYGTMNARVDASGDGQYAEIDDEGRYKVKLPFDQSSTEGGKASRFIRMAQPYAGADYGMHFPLHKGTEVLLTFVDGDPDRPIIAGSVPNPETMSPVTGGNQTQSMIRTGGGNQIRIEDGSGGQQIHLSSPTSNSVISLGAVNEGNIFLRSDGTWVSNIGDDATEEIGGDKRTIVAGDEEKNIGVNQGVHVSGNQFLQVDSDRTVRVAGKEDKKVGSPSFIVIAGFSSKRQLAATHELFVGAKATQNLAATSEFTGGVKQSAFAGLELSTNASVKIDRISGLHIENNSATKRLTAAAKFAQIIGAKEEKAGSYEMDATSTIDLKAGANITITGSKIVLKAGNIELDGNVVISGNCEVDGFLQNPNFVSPP